MSYYGYDPSQYKTDFSWIGDIGSHINKVATQLPELLQLNQDIKDKKSYKQATFDGTQKMIELLDDDEAEKIARGLGAKPEGEDPTTRAQIAKQYLNDRLSKIKFGERTTNEEYSKQIYDNFFEPVVRSAQSNNISAGRLVAKLQSGSVAGVFESSKLGQQYQEEQTYLKNKDRSMGTINPVTGKREGGDLREVGAISSEISQAESSQKDKIAAIKAERNVRQIAGIVKKFPDRQDGIDELDRLFPIIEDKKTGEQTIDPNYETSLDLLNKQYDSNMSDKKDEVSIDNLKKTIEKNSLPKVQYVKLDDALKNKFAPELRAYDKVQSALNIERNKNSTNTPDFNKEEQDINIRNLEGRLKYFESTNQEIDAIRTELSANPSKYGVDSETGGYTDQQINAAAETIKPQMQDQRVKTVIDAYRGFKDRVNEKARSEKEIKKYMDDFINTGGPTDIFEIQPARELIDKNKAWTIDNIKIIPNKFQIGLTKQFASKGYKDYFNDKNAAINETVSPYEISPTSTIKKSNEGSKYSLNDLPNLINTPERKAVFDQAIAEYKKDNPSLDDEQAKAKFIINLNDQKLGMTNSPVQSEPTITPPLSTKTNAASDQDIFIKQILANPTTAKDFYKFASTFNQRTSDIDVYKAYYNLKHTQGYQNNITTPTDSITPINTVDSNIINSDTNGLIKPSSNY